MILSHRAPSSLNMSSYRAIWTHFRPNFIFFGRKNLRSWPKISDCQKSKLFQKCKSPHLAILINIWHIWDCRSRKVNNDELDLRFFCGNFWPVIDQAVRKPCPRGVYRFHPFPEKWLASGFLDSRWVPGFTIGSWIHDGSSILRKAEDLMPRDIMSS